MPISFGGLKQIVDGGINTNQHMIFRGDNGVFIDSAGQLTWLSLDPLNYYTFQGGGFCSAPASGFLPFTNFYYSQSGNLINYPNNGCAQFAEHERGSALNLIYTSPAVETNALNFLNNKIATYFVVSAFDPLATSGFIFENGSLTSSFLFGPFNNLNLHGCDPGGPFNWFQAIDGQNYFPGDGTTSGFENPYISPFTDGSLKLFTILIDRNKPVGSHVRIRLNGIDSVNNYPVYGSFNQNFAVGQSGNIALMDLDAGQNACNNNTCLPVLSQTIQIGEFRWYTYLPDVASIESSIMSFWGI